MDKITDTYLAHKAQKSLAASRSTRTTFKLSQNSINALSELSKVASQTTKEVIGTICKSFEQDETLRELAQNLLNEKNSGKLKRRKTYVLPNGALKFLNTYSKKHNIPRDIIFDTFIKVYWTLLKYSEEIEKEKAEQALVIVRKICGSLVSAEEELKQILDEDNAILSRISYLCVLADELVASIKKYLSEGTPISNDPFE